MKKQLFTGKKPMRVACLMSGVGSNVEALIRHKTDAYIIIAIITDNPECNAEYISDKHHLPYIPFSNFTELTHILEWVKPDVVALAGFRHIVPPKIIDKYLTLNVHPADLRVHNGDGDRAYKGSGHEPVLKAILAGEKELRSTVHIAREQVDMGEILKVSNPLPVRLPKRLSTLKRLKHHEELVNVAVALQNLLKQTGDWQIYPAVLEEIANGEEFDVNDAVSVCW